MICDPNDRSDDVLLGGGIQRIDASSDFLTQLDAVADDPLAQAELYATAGAWQETITLAASLRSQNPDAWAELLTSVDLDFLANQPIIGQPVGQTPGQTAEQTDPTESPTGSPTSMPNGSGDLQRLLEGINP